MSIMLTPMHCQRCNALLQPQHASVAKRKAAHSYLSCYWKCARCLVGYSNGKNEHDRRLIYQTWQANLPVEVHSDVERVIKHSLNVKSRRQKLTRFHFESSEDAVTWTVFRYLQDQQLWNNVFRFQANHALLWGVEYPIVGNPDREHIRSELSLILENSLKEDADSFSEPDVIVANDQQLVFVEVKYEAVNPRQRNYRHFDRYLQAALGLFKDHDDVKEKGHYELTRNLVIAQMLAKELRINNWKVINLGKEACRASALEVAASLNDTRLFEFVTWRDFCQRIPKPRQQWFDDYLRSKGLT